MLLNPALATQQSLSSRVPCLCSLQKNSLLHGPGLSWWNLVTWGNTTSRNHCRNQISAFNHLFHEILFFLQAFLLPSFPAHLPPSATPKPRVICTTMQLDMQLWCPSRTIFINVVHTKRWGSMEKIAYHHRTKNASRCLYTQVQIRVTYTTLALPFLNFCSLFGGLNN